MGGTAAAGSALAGPRAWAARPGPGGARVAPRDQAFDDDWRFSLGDVDQGQNPDLDDSSWRRLELPHDWSIEDLSGAPARPDNWAAPAAIWSPTTRPGPPGEWLEPQVPPSVPGGPPTRTGPFDVKASTGGYDVGWTVGGVGWYRKRFRLPGRKPDEQIELRFDGVYMVTQVWLNGVLLGGNFNGYTPFAFDLTPHLSRGDNVLAVRVANEGKTSRWYSGSGIYRHVWLTVTGPLRFPLWTAALTTPEVAADHARIKLSLDVENRSTVDRPASVRVGVYAPDGKRIATGGQPLALSASGTSTASLELALTDPTLWSPDHPALYRLEAELMQDGRVVDRQSLNFGLRKVEIDAQQGLRVNGEPLKLKGACLHHDHAFLGAIALGRAERRKVELLKARGFNAIRCSHNAYSPAFLDACDALGMLVIDEVFDVWERPKRPQDYSRFFADHWRRDLETVVRRDRNHPCVILWSLGNEIPEARTPRGEVVAQMLREAILAIDPTRQITAALAPGVFGPGAASARKHLDVVGYNYMHAAYEPDYAANPGTVFVGTEQCAQYMHDAWLKVEAHPWVIGDFVWTGIDYLGEVGSGSSQLRPTADTRTTTDLTIFLWDYPAYLSGCGDIDIIGKPKPQSHYRDVLWRRSPLELFVQRPTPDGYFEEVDSWGWHDELASWTWPVPSGAPMTVRAYTHAEEVRFQLNGREVGRKVVTADSQLVAQLAVPYEPGELVAIAYTGGAEVARASLTTAGAPARVRLRPEPGPVGHTRDDLAYVYAEVLDAQDRLVPDAMTPMAFHVSGPAELAGAGSANPRGLESLRDPYCRAFHGLAQAIVRPTGKAGVATLEVVAPGLKGDRVRIRLG